MSEETTQTAVSVSADTLATGLNRLVDDGTITTDDKGLILWLATEAKRDKLSHADLAKKIGYSPTTFSRVFNCRYEGDYSKVTDAIRKYRHLAAQRAKMVNAEYIETTIWSAIRNTCDLALFNQMPAMIIGISQIGKSEALKEYARRSDYIVRYVRMPASPSMRFALDAIAEACGVNITCKLDDLRRRIAKALDNRTLLIIDEVHQLAISSGKSTAMRVMEYIRELHDMSQCGLVICGTNALEEDLINGELKAWLDQFRQRCIKRTYLPKALPLDDIALTCKAYGLTDIPVDIDPMLKGIRMNRLVKTLGMARTLASRRGQDNSWECFSAAYNTLDR